MTINITNQGDLLKAKKIVQLLEELINETYSKLAKQTDIKKIIFYQNYIDKCKRKKLGYFGLISIYDRIVNEKKPVITYIVSDGDTLPDIAKAYYGKTEYWQYLYTKNNLSDDKLTSNDEIVIYEMPDNAEVILYQAEIMFAEFIVFLKENGIDLRQNG